MQTAWYVLKVRVGSEKRIAKAIKDVVARKSYEDYVTDVSVPTSYVVEIHQGKKKQIERNLFPGYVMICMIENKDVMQALRGISGVYNFLGNSSANMLESILPSEAERIFSDTADKRITIDEQLSFEIGEQVKICSGPFTAFTGMVEEVDKERARLHILVSIFDRATPVELGYSEVSKIDLDSD